MCYNIIVIKITNNPVRSYIWVFMRGVRMNGIRDKPNENLI